jgi:hypothetical protein
MLTRLARVGDPEYDKGSRMIGQGGAVEDI